MYAIIKTSGKQYTYYCCEFTGAKGGDNVCDFMTWDVPVKDDCPQCGQTMFKKAGRGFNRPFCVNPECANFLPEEKRGYRRKTASTDGEKTAAKKTVKKTAARKTAAKKTTAKKATTKKTTAKKTTAKKTGKEKA